MRYILSIIFITLALKSFSQDICLREIFSERYQIILNSSEDYRYYLSTYQRLLKQPGNDTLKECELPKQIIPWANKLYKFNYGTPIEYYDAQKQLVADTVFLHEILLYKFKGGQTIADIGAGSAYFERGISKYSDQLTVYVTEIDSAMVSQMETRLLLLDSTDRKNIKYITVKGTTETTGLPLGIFDKIIIRNTFHHFSDPDFMLQQIRPLLKKGGRLYIVDIMAGTTRNKPACNAHLMRTTFMDYMKRNGYVLIKEMPLQYDEFILFEFKVK